MKQEAERKEESIGHFYTLQLKFLFGNPTSAPGNCYQKVDICYQMKKIRNQELFEEIIENLATNGYAIAEEVFDKAVLSGLHARLLEHIVQRDLQVAAIGNHLQPVKNTSVRSDKIKWIDEHTDDPFEQAFTREVKELCDYLNRTCYTGIRGFEFHYACFEKGAFYKRHLDRFRNDESRKFSMITYLNETWTAADGGQLVLYLPNETVTIEPEWGRTIIFKSEQIEHEVLQSYKDRLSVTGWLK